MFQLMLIDKKFQDVHGLLTQAGHLVDGWQGSQYQKEYLKVFFLVLQVCHALNLPPLVSRVANGTAVLALHHCQNCLYLQMSVLAKCVSLPDGRSGEECQALFEATTTKHPNNNAAIMAI
uniref:Uncharacterized protein n=1 Tax=Timema genevievae TaxID=629358 RepID=A0A7R9K861_TIMGE|nr:unnamed protein product [Timema genevievae]